MVSFSIVEEEKKRMKKKKSFSADYVSPRALSLFVQLVGFLIEEGFREHFVSGGHLFVSNRKLAIYAISHGVNDIV